MASRIYFNMGLKMLVGWLVTDDDVDGLYFKTDLAHRSLAPLLLPRNRSCTGFYFRPVVGYYCGTLYILVSLAQFYMNAQDNFC